MPKIPFYKRRAEPAPADRQLDASTKPFRRRRELRCTMGFAGYAVRGRPSAHLLVLVGQTPRRGPIVLPFTPL